MSEIGKIEKYVKGKKTYYRFEEVVYYNPEVKGFPRKKMYKKIKKSNIERRSDAKRIYQQKRHEAIEEIQKKAEEFFSKKNVMTLEKAHLQTLNINISEGSRKKYDYYFKNYIAKFFDVHKNVEEVLNHDSIIDFVNWIDKIQTEKNYAKKTKYFQLKRARNIFEYAIHRTSLDESIIKPVIADSKWNKTVLIDINQVWNKEEIDSFINAFSKEDFVFKVFYMVMERGLRFNETRALKVNDVYKRSVKNKVRYYVNINKQMKNGYSYETKETKSLNSEREIEISESVFNEIKILEEKHNLNADDFLFKNPETNVIYSNTKIRGKFNEYKNIAVPNKTKMRPHYFRHRLATESIDKGFDIITVAKHLGDTKQSVLDTYVLDSPSDKSLLDI